MQSFRCLVQKHFPLATLSYSPLLIFMKAKTPATFRMAIRSASRYLRSLISEKLILPLDKLFFVSHGNRLVKAIHPALSPGVSGSTVALIGKASPLPCSEYDRVAREAPFHR
jgi:hypothetical protein